jgi:hypothetical protein
MTECARAATSAGNGDAAGIQEWQLESSYMEATHLCNGKGKGAHVPDDVKRFLVAIFKVSTSTVREEAITQGLDTAIAGDTILRQFDRGFGDWLDMMNGVG